MKERAITTGPDKGMIEIEVRCLTCNVESRARGPAKLMGPARENLREAEAKHLRENPTHEIVA